MRILYLGLAKGHAGGVPIYTESLLQGMHDQGHTVTHIYVGTHNLKMKAYLKKIADESGKVYIELINSPLEYFNIDSPLREIKEPITESLVVQFIKDTDPQIIHIQNLMGFSSSIIEIASDLGYPVIVSHHNYWFICPRIELVRSDKQLCEGPVDGLNCSLCCSKVDDRHRTSSFLFKLNRRIRGTLKPYVRSSNLLSKLENILRPQQKGLPDISRTLRHFSNSPRYSYDLEAQYGLSKPISPQKVLQYSLRAKYHRYLLSKKVTLNLAVSSCVKSILSTFGVPENKILVQHIGTKAAEFIRPLPKPPLHECVIFGFLGPLRYEKGVHLLIRAFTELNSSRSFLKIYGGVADAGYYAYLKHLTCKHNNIMFYGPYKHEELSNILAGIHYLVVPPVWHDNAPQVVFEALSSKTPVIGANIGGIPDFIQDGVNGYLFEVGKIKSIIDCMKRCLDDQYIYSKLQDKIKPMKTMKEHIIELENIYRAICKDKGMLE